MTPSVPERSRSISTILKAFIVTRDISIKRPHDAKPASPLFEITRVLVRLDQIASRIVNTNHRIM
jgi:hypothetical protein